MKEFYKVDESAVICGEEEAATLTNTATPKYTGRYLTNIRSFRLNLSGDGLLLIEPAIWV
jgi:hypothetical protein